MTDRSIPPSSTPQSARPRRPGATAPPAWAWWLAGLSVVIAAGALYWPTLKAGFLTWDDEEMILANPLVLSPRGWSAIWTRTAHAPGWPNYPLFYTSLWLNHRFWGFDPAPYHATNVALHALNALLAMCLLRRLGLSRVAAWLCALLFALHPLQVESVAWITERKNVLSGTFYLAAFLLYARHRQTGRWWTYGLALLAYIGALLSKTASVTFVPSLFLADWLVFARPGQSRRSRLTASLGRLIPFALAGVAAALVLVSVEEPPPASVSLVFRPLLAARVLWFYVGKLLLPLEPTPIYPLWTVDAGTLTAWLPLLVVLLVAVAVYRWRATLGGLAVWGLGHFVVTLLPVSGLAGFGYHDHSFVADRFVYLASLGLFAALAAGVERMLARRRHSAPAIGVLAGGLVAVVAAGVLTWRQIPVWHDSYSFWLAAVTGNPSSWMAQHSSATQLAFRGRFDEALSHFRKCVALRPSFAPAQMMIGVMLKQLGDLDAAEAQLRQAGQQAPQFVPLRAMLADVWAAKGHVPESVQLLRQIIADDPSAVVAHERLAWILATAPDPLGLGSGEAVRAAQQAARLTLNLDAQPLDTLGVAYAAVGRFDRAIDAAEHALVLARRNGQEYLAAQIEKRLAGYRAGRPYLTALATSEPRTPVG